MRRAYLRGARSWRAWAALTVCLTIAAAVGAQAPGAPAFGQGAGASTADQGPGASLQISVLTFGPGDQVFERFGHNALRVRDAATGQDLAYNWGMFSFEEPNFLGRFLTGDTRYWVEAFPTTWLLAAYARADRETTEQVLALTPPQRAALAAFVARNALPENRYYRYDYFRDNCSTRLRDALDLALDGSLKRRFAPVNTPWTYRSESVRLTAPAGLAQAGIDIALGPRADIPITAWESMFIPMRLRDFLREVTVPAPGGGTRPLVSAEQVLYDATRAPPPAERRGLTIGAWGPILGAWMLLLVPFSSTARRRTRVPAAVMAVVWYGVTGILGVALLGMWVGSAHVFWYNNWSLLLVSPLGLAVAVPAARAALRERASRPLRVLVGLVVGMAALAVVLWPFLRQDIGGPLLLFLPGHLGLALALWLRTRPARG